MGPCPLFLFAGLFRDGGFSVSVLPLDDLARVRAIVERVARSCGLELFDLQLRREPIGWVLRVVIDQRTARDAQGNVLPGGIGDSVRIEDCQRVSHDVSTILDAENVLGDDVFGQSYTLEVSSPGLDRPLRQADDYRRFAGRLAKLVLGEPVNGQRYVEGRIKEVDGDSVVVETGRRTHRIPLALITRARLEVEF